MSSTAELLDIELEKNQYFCFFVQEKIFSVPVKKVTEIIEIDQMRNIPTVPDHLMGVVNLRGSIVPLVSLTKLMNLPVSEKQLSESKENFPDKKPEKHTKQCVVMIETVIEEETLNIGILIDRVHQVIDIDESDITEPPSLGLDIKREYVVGVVRLDGKFVIFLDLNQLFSIESVSYLGAAANKE
jgi:purine-binding chemotaxis protein CheW